MAWHCAVMRGGRKIDCVMSDEPPSIVGQLRGDTIYLNIKSTWEGSCKAKLYLNEEGSQLVWKITEQNGQNYLPSHEILKKKNEKTAQIERREIMNEKTPIDYEEDENPDFIRMHKIATADYGKCYIIDNYMLCPEKKLILKEAMYGTETKNCIGFFPDSTLKYNEARMIIFAGKVFFDKSDLGINWQTVQLLSYNQYNTMFTDGETIYSIDFDGIRRSTVKYDKNSYKPYVEEKREKRNLNGVRELTEDFCVKGNTFYFGSFVEDDFNEGAYMLTPILESFDVPNLRTIVSDSGFETDYITDDKQVIFGGGKTGYSSIEKNGKTYVIAKDWIIEGIDFASLRVLGKKLLVDKNAIYYGTNIIPFSELDGFKFIFREM